jgi:hypothetical protein
MFAQALCMKLLIIANPAVRVDIDGSRVSWSQISTNLSALKSYSCFLIIPDVDASENAQMALADALLAEVKHRKGRSISVVWLLSNAEAREVARNLGFGQAVPLGGSNEILPKPLIPGIELTSEEKLYALSAPSVSIRPLIEREPVGLQKKAVLGSWCENLRWAFIPPVKSFKWISRKYCFGVPRSYVALIPIIWFCIAAAIAFYLYRTASLDFAERVESLPAVLREERQFFSKLPFDLDREWLDPGARMVIRVFRDHSSELFHIARKLDSSSSSFDLWLRDKRRPAPYFYLALMAGDLPSALNIVSVSHAEPQVDVDDTIDPRWQSRLTGVFWQASVEYLHELDFGRASQYNLIFMDAFRHLPASWPPRNGTLSHILDREIKSGRIRELCTQPGAGKSFGLLLGGTFGSGLPGRDPPGLVYRRNLNARSQCRNSSATETGSPRISYDLLGDLRDSGGRPTICAFFETECNYQSLVNELPSVLEKRPGSDDPNLVGILNFIASCSYLSDDLAFSLFDGLRQIRSEGSDATRTKIPIGALVEASACLRRANGDYSRRALRLLHDMPCRTIEWQKVNANMIGDTELKQKANSCVADGQ